MRQNPLIFIIDDDPVILKICESELRTIKMDVMCFSYGEDCLPELLLAPDLIVLDYIFVNGNKPVFSGLEILHLIRQKNQEVPVIILSGQESGSAVLELIKLGIEEYIIKEKGFTVKLKDAVINALQKEQT